MFNSIGWGEIMLLLLVALFIFGPDRLPAMAKDAAGALQKVRGFVTGARAQLREELGDEFADIDLRSLNPREFVKRQLLDDDPPPLLKRSNGSRPTRVDTAKSAALEGAAAAESERGDSVGPVAVDVTKPVSARMAQPPGDADPVRLIEPASSYDDVT